jgi:hypothetical protein
MSTVQEQTILAKLQQRGHWRVVIRPTTFKEKHVPNYGDLFPIVAKNSVQLRGWDYPHIDNRRPPDRGADWVGQECDWQHEIEVWRLYQSGQFLHYFALTGEWRDQSEFWPADGDWKPGRFLYYVDTIYTLLEIYEFAARLAQSPAGAGTMRVEISLKHLSERRLATEDIHVVLHGDYRTRMGEWQYPWQGPQTELIASPRDLAASAAKELFDRFGLPVSVDTLKRIQERIGRL